MKKNFIGKSILSIAAISLTVSTFAGESHAQTKAEKYNEYQTNFKKQVNKKVVDAQKAVNLFKRTRTVATHFKIIDRSHAIECGFFTMCNLMKVI